MLIVIPPKSANIVAWDQNTRHCMGGLNVLDVGPRRPAASSLSDILHPLIRLERDRKDSETVSISIPRTRRTACHRGHFAVLDVLRDRVAFVLRVSHGRTDIDAPSDLHSSLDQCR